jgi:hypothetical protein
MCPVVLGTCHLDLMRNAHKDLMANLAFCYLNPKLQIVSIVTCTGPPTSHQPKLDVRQFWTCCHLKLVLPKLNYEVGPVWFLCDKEKNRCARFPIKHAWEDLNTWQSDSCQKLLIRQSISFRQRGHQGDPMKELRGSTFFVFENSEIGRWSCWATSGGNISNHKKLFF